MIRASYTCIQVAHLIARHPNYCTEACINYYLYIVLNHWINESLSNNFINDFKAFLNLDFLINRLTRAMLKNCRK